METKVRDFLKEKIQSGIFTGASVIFGKPNQKLVEVHEGTLGRGLSEPVTSQTLFDLQSITKSVATSALFLKLLNEGKVRLDETIASYLGTENRNPAHEEITFQQLLTHSSGLSDNDLAGDFGTAETLWHHMLLAKPQIKPGTAIEYTDLGYRLLGKALENIVGSNLDEACKSFIWQPLGLHRLTYNPVEQNETAATPDAHGIIDDEQVHFLGGVLGCDGVFSNAEDLFNLMSAMLTESEVFSENCMAPLTRNQARCMSSPRSFFETLAIGTKNLGWEVNPRPFSYAGKFQTGTVIEKAGGAGTFIWMDPDTQSIAVYLTNHGKPKPFDETNWNQLLNEVAPHQLSNLWVG